VLESEFLISIGQMDKCQISSISRVVKDSGLSDISMSKNVVRHLTPRQVEMSDILLSDMSKNVDVVVEKFKHALCVFILLYILFYLTLAV